MNYKIAQFILTPAAANQSTLEIYVAQPDANKEALAGKLFALIEIVSTKAVDLKIINFLINTLNFNYYQNEKMILRERVESIKIEHIFESALAKTNKKLAEFLQNEKIKLNPGILNITVGVIFNNSLHFASTGKNSALLIYKNQITQTAKYKLIDIAEQSARSETKKQTSSIKLFSNVISGDLPSGGYFIFANETFGEYLSPKQIINIITTLPPASAAEQIKNTLSKINAYVPFLGIIIKNNFGLPAEETIETVSSTKDSIEKLIVTEERTEKLLTPSGLINVKKWPLFFGNVINYLPWNKNKQKKAFLLKDRIFTKKKTSWSFFRKIIRTLKNSLLYSISLSGYIFKIITDKKSFIDFCGNILLKIKNISLSGKNVWQKTFFWYQRLTGISKILFSIFIVCLLFFSVNMGVQNIKNKEIEKQTAITSLVALIEQKQNQIDASLLYNNEAGASKQLSEITKLLQQLPKNNESQKDQYNKFMAKHQVQIEKIRHVIRANPAELANFFNLNASAKPKNIIIAKGKIYAADAAQSLIYSIDLSSKLITSINLGNNKFSRLDSPSIDKNNNIYYLDSAGLVVLDIKSEKISVLDIDYKGSLEKTVDLKQYNNRFYLTDITDGKIYRFTRNVNKLISPTAWLSSIENLSDVVSLDIDGDIYLLKKDGKILKFTKGKKQNFESAAIEPPLNQARKIVAPQESNFLYILEPANRRLIVFDKEGKFVNQYTSDKFNNLEDFQIDESNKIIYFLNNSAVYSVAASHLDK